MSALSAEAYTTTLLLMVDRVKRGMLCTSHPRQAGLNLPSSWNVLQKVAIASLFVLPRRCSVLRSKSCLYCLCTAKARVQKVRKKKIPMECKTLRIT